MVIEIRIEDGLKVTGLPYELIDLYRSICFFHLEENDEVKEIDLFQQINNTVVLPRGLLQDLIQSLQNRNLEYKLIDQESKYENCIFNINPKINYTTGPFGYQGLYVNELINNYKIGRLQAPTAAGKTVLACLITALLGKGPILFLADKDVLLRQFQREACKVLQLKPEDIGIIKRDKFEIKPVTLGSLRTVGKSTFDIDRIRNKFYMVFYDEVHYGSAYTSQNAVLNIGSERLYGLSATPIHPTNDTKNEIMKALFGPVVVKIPESVIPKRLVPQIIVRNTNLSFYYDSQREFPTWKRHKLMHNMKSAISDNEDRNKIIVADTYNLVKQLNHKVIICVDRVEHGKVLQEKLTDLGLRVSFPYTFPKNGKHKVDHKQLDLDAEELEDGNLDVIMGTYKLFDTGFNVRVLSAIQLVGNINGKNTTAIEQSTGRILRYLPEKTAAVVLDYADNSHPHPLLNNWALGRAEFLKSKYNNLTYI